ncbi:MAG: OsmC family peroxiredoxin, partial [Pseudoxanthomonas sp.]
EEGIVLDLLEVQAGSRSDTRGVLRMQDETGVAVYAGSQDLQLQVRIGAHAVPEETLRALVEEGLRCSPVPTAVRNGTPLAVRVEIAQVRLEAG